MVGGIQWRVVEYCEHSSIIGMCLMVNEVWQDSHIGWGAKERVSDSEGAGDCDVLASVEIIEGVFHFLIMFLIFFSLLDDELIVIYR